MASLQVNSVVGEGSPKGLERETGFEPATACLEGRDSTTELLPLDTRIIPQRHGEL